jgi:hypothetical protein
MTCEVTHPNRAKTTNNPAAFKIAAPMQNIPFMLTGAHSCLVPRSLLCRSSRDRTLLYAVFEGAAASAVMGAPRIPKRPNANLLCIINWLLRTNHNVVLTAGRYRR